mgnify:CR=1 FL=1
MSVRPTRRADKGIFGPGFIVLEISPPEADRRVRQAGRAA